MRVEVNPLRVVKLEGNHINPSTQSRMLQPEWALILVGKAFFSGLPRAELCPVVEDLNRIRNDTPRTPGLPGGVHPGKVMTVRHQVRDAVFFDHESGACRQGVSVPGHL